MADVCVVPGCEFRRKRLSRHMSVKCYGHESSPLSAMCADFAAIWCACVLATSSLFTQQEIEFRCGILFGTDSRKKTHEKERQEEGKEDGKDEEEEVLRARR